MAKRKKRKQPDTPRNIVGVQGNNKYPPQGKYIHSNESNDFARMQQDVAPHHKELAAKWVLDELSFGSGAGLILDAGSSCCQLWKETAKAIVAGDCAHLTIYTNNLLVLDEWREGSTPRSEVQRSRFSGGSLTVLTVRFMAAQMRCDSASWTRISDPGPYSSEPAV